MSTEAPVQPQALPKRAQALPRRMPFEAPKKGDILSGTRSGKIELKRLIGVGGNSQVFETTDGRAVKIFEFPENTDVSDSRYLGEATPEQEAGMQSNLP